MVKTRAEAKKFRRCTPARSCIRTRYRSRMARLSLLTKSPRPNQSKQATTMRVPAARRRNPRMLTTLRQKKVSEFLKLFQMTGPRKYGSYASESWISSLIDAIKVGERWDIRTEDVRHWMATESFFENWNNMYELNISSGSSPTNGAISASANVPDHQSVAEPLGFGSSTSGIVAHLPNASSFNTLRRLSSDGNDSEPECLISIPPLSELFSLSTSTNVPDHHSVAEPLGFGSSTLGLVAHVPNASSFSTLPRLSSDGNDSEPECLISIRPLSELLSPSTSRNAFETGSDSMLSLNNRATKVQELREVRKYAELLHNVLLREQQAGPESVYDIFELTSMFYCSSLLLSKITSIEGAD